MLLPWVKLREGAQGHGQDQGEAGRHWAGRRGRAKCKNTLLSTCASERPPGQEYLLQVCAPDTSPWSNPWTPPHFPPPAWILLERGVWGVPPYSGRAKGAPPGSPSGARAQSCLRASALAVFFAPKALSLDTCMTRSLAPFTSLVTSPARASLTFLA